MKTITIKIFSIQTAALLLLASSAAAVDYQGLAERMAGAAKANGISRVALASFSVLGGTESEARYAREKTGAGLSAVKGLEVLDQDALQAYAGEKISLKKLPSKDRPQAFIKGTLFQEGEEITLLVKLVDSRSGRVLETAEMKAYSRFSGLPPVPEMNWGEPVASAPMKNDFRDALADNGFDCTAAFKRMAPINAAAVDLKARYWARKIKEPGFVTGSLTRNPGSEIRDRGVRSRFYELLASYHEKDEVPPLPDAQLRKLEDFMGRESDVIDRCGSK